MPRPFRLALFIAGLPAVLLVACSAAPRSTGLLAPPIPQPFSDASFALVASRTVADLVESGAMRRWDQLGEPSGIGDLSLPPLRRAASDAAGVYADAAPSVLAILSFYKCDKCPRWHVGTAAAGFVIADGVLATNHHVVDTASTRIAAAVTCRGDVLPIIGLLASDAADDAAILRFDTAGINLEPIPLRAGAPVGTPVVAIAHPDKKYWTLTEGIISRRAAVFGGVNGDQPALRPKDLSAAPPTGQTYEPVFRDSLRPILTVTADFGVGSSGGPILDLAGNAVAMIASTHTVFSAADGHDHDREPQMTIRTCVPAESLLRLLGR